MDRYRRAFLGGALAAFFSGALAVPLLSSAANAGEDPIPLIDVIVERTPPGAAFASRTDRMGYLTFKSLAPGTYILTDSHGKKAKIRHPGGPAHWRLVERMSKGTPVRTLIDASNLSSIPPRAGNVRRSK